MSGQETPRPEIESHLDIAPIFYGVLRRILGHHRKLIGPRFHQADSSTRASGVGHIEIQFLQLHINRGGKSFIGGRIRKRHNPQQFLPDAAALQLPIMNRLNVSPQMPVIPDTDGPIVLQIFKCILNRSAGHAKLFLIFRHGRDTLPLISG